MGPILIFDKSAFQALSSRELSTARSHFIQNFVPLLAFEILADLSKTGGAATPEDQVTRLARKFFGSGRALSMDYRRLCIQDLAGNSFPMDGRIIPHDMNVFQTPDGRTGGMIEPSPLNLAIIRWSKGQFEEYEKLLAKAWRELTTGLTLEEFRDQLNSRHVIVPRAESPEEVAGISESLSTDIGLQEVWLEWLVSQLTPSRGFVSLIKGRWQANRPLRIRDFAPYAHFCLLAQLAVLVAVWSRLVAWKPTNILDLQYLYYLPFCMAFVSNDGLHKVIAPILLRDDQDFVEGTELKRDLRRIADSWDSLDERRQRRLAYALGSYPLPAEGSIVSRLWAKHCKPWRPGAGSLMSDLPENEQELAIREAMQLFQGGNITG
jgi:hypothetical protein